MVIDYPVRTQGKHWKTHILLGNFLPEASSYLIWRRVGVLLYWSQFGGFVGGWVEGTGQHGSNSCSLTKVLVRASWDSVLLHALIDHKEANVFLCCDASYISTMLYSATPPSLLWGTGCLVHGIWRNWVKEGSCNFSDRTQRITVEMLAFLTIFYSVLFSLVKTKQQRNNKCNRHSLPPVDGPQAFLQTRPHWIMTSILPVLRQHKNGKQLSD